MPQKVKLGVKEVELTTVKNGDVCFIRRATIIYDPSTEKGRGISQIVDGLRRIVGLKEYKGEIVGNVDLEP